MYQSYPTPDTPQAQSERPRRVQTAIRLMYAGAALSGIAVVISLVTIGSLKTAIEQQNTGLTASQVNTAEGVAIGAAVVGGLIAIGLWLWMAWANGKGRSWARTTSAVFFGINTLDLVVTIARVHASVSLIFSFIVWVVGLAAIVLLFNKENAPFYQQGSMRR